MLDALKDHKMRFSGLLWLTLFSFPLGMKGLTNVLFLLVVLNGIITLRGSEWRRGFNSPLFLWSAGFFALHVLSLLWSTDIAQGLRQIETKTAFLLAPLIIVAGRERYVRNFRDKALKALLAGNVAASLIALGYATFLSIQAGAFYRTVETGRQFFFLYKHLSEPIMHPGYFSTYLGFGCLISLYFLLRKKERFRWLYIFLFAFFFVMIVLAQGRINLLALIAVLVGGTLIYVLKTRAYKWLLVPAVPLVFFLIFLAFGPENLKKRYFLLPDFSYDISGTDFNSATYRLAEWSSAMDVLEEHPVIGAGVGDNREALMDSYRENKFWKGLERGFNAHSQYIETALAVGAVGLVLLLGLCYYYGRLALLLGDYLTLSALVFFMICMLTESMLERSWAVMLFASYFPLILCLGRREALQTQQE